MNVFVFEHLCGGIAGDEAAMLPSEMLRQGSAMLRAAMADFQALNAVVHTMLNSRADIDLDGLHVTVVDRTTNIPATFDALAAEADVTLVIAPETDDLLVSWLARLEKLQVASLNCTVEAARLCGDKLKLWHHLGVVNIPTPPTQLLSEAKTLEYPVVVKPRFGAGCEDTFLCRGPDDLDQLPGHKDYIVQPFIAGVDASCSLIVHGSTITPLPAGEQRIQGDMKMSYRGGNIPIEANLAGRAARLAQDAAAWIPGLRGFVGVDVILGNHADDDRVIEINPRLTLSYAALSRLCATNLAAAIVDPEAPLKWKKIRLRFDAGGGLLS